MDSALQDMLKGLFNCNVHNKKYENGKRKTLIGKGRYVAKIVDQQIIKLS